MEKKDLSDNPPLGSLVPYYIQNLNDKGAGWEPWCFNNFTEWGSYKKLAEEKANYDAFHFNDDVDDASHKIPERLDYDYQTSHKNGMKSNHWFELVYSRSSRMLSWITSLMTFEKHWKRISSHLHSKIRTDNYFWPTINITFVSFSQCMSQRFRSILHRSQQIDSSNPDDTLFSFNYEIIEFLKIFNE